MVRLVPGFIARRRAATCTRRVADGEARVAAIHYQNGHDGGGWSSAIRRFLVLDGEHAGSRVEHGEMSYRHDDGDWSEPTEKFPPAGLEAAAPVSDLREDQQ
jgi:hypothetical protein